MQRREEPNSIAIIGMGCRLPGGIASPQQFWELLSRGGDAIREVPAERWDTEALFAADPAAPGRTYARRGGFLNDIENFDAEFFGISPREAAHVDPQQRLLLETAHEAMEDAGERWEAPAVRNTGVFVGVFIHDYQHMQFADRELLGAHTGTGTAMSIAANRISYVFDLHGPSIAVDTACSSSLVAVDLACKALLQGDCDYALAGGVNVMLKPEMTIAMSKATMLSKDGSCKSFDARADGYVRGEGAGLVVLRRLSDARAAGNSI
jgi:acyl transferase domain-containing protein